MSCRLNCWFSNIPQELGGKWLPQTIKVSIGKGKVLMGQNNGGGGVFEHGILKNQLCVMVKNSCSNARFSYNLSVHDRAEQKNR